MSDDKKRPTVQSPPNAKSKSLKQPGEVTASARIGKHQFVANGQNFVIDSKYVPKANLGTGAYGVVISAGDKTTNNKVAIKKVTDGFQDVVDAKRVLREVKLLKHLKHENIVSLVDMVDPPSFEDFNDIYIIFEYMETDLHKILYSKNKLTDDHIQFFLYQMLAGLKYIHSANVMHRDLKPSNLLLNSDCTLKICDFGLARGFSNDPLSNEFTEYVVTRWYRAPEIMCSCQEYDCKIDVWAAGCIFAELLGREPLFPGEDYIDQMKLIFKTLGTPDASDMDFVTNENALHFIQSLPPTKPKNLKKQFAKSNPLAVDLLEKMLAFNPTKRISVADALNHPYLKELTEDLDNHKHECKEPFDFEFEKIDLRRKEAIQALMYEEIRTFRPNMPKIANPPEAVREHFAKKGLL